MVNLKVLSVIAKKTATTEDADNLDVRYKYNLETIVKAMLLSIKDDDPNSDKVQYVHDILADVLADVLTDGKTDSIARIAYGIYFGDISGNNSTVAEVAQRIAERWNCLYPYTKAYANDFIVTVARARLNAPADIVKRISKQNYKKALCVAWANAYVHSNTPDPAEEWEKRYTYTYDVNTRQLQLGTEQ